MRGLLALSVLAVLALTGCGVSPKVNPGDQPADLPLGAPAQPVADWRSFPVDRKPRPIVLLGSLPGMAGFSSGDAKVSALAGQFTLTTGLPALPGPETKVTLPDGPATVRLIDARTAFDTMIRGLRDKPDPSVKPLPIERVELGTARFSTDRGPWTLPAWLFHPKDGLGPISWPALDPAALWRPGDVIPLSASGTLSADGRKLVVMMPKPPGPCPGDEPVKTSPVITESATTVTVDLATTGKLGNCARTLALNHAPVDYALSTPLGARVVVTKDGAPVAVTS